MSRFGYQDESPEAPRAPATAPSLMSQRSIARAKGRQAAARTDAVLMVILLVLGFAAAFLVFLGALVFKRPAVLVLLLAGAGCATVQVNLGIDTGSGSSHVRGAKQDVAPSTSNVTTTATQVEVPVSLVPK